MDTPTTELKSFSPGTAVVLNGATNQGWFYLVTKGRLRLQSERDYKDPALTTFEKGDTFGIVSALTGQPYMCTILADLPSEILRIPIRQLGEFFSKEKSTIVKILSRYTKELRALDRQLASDPEKATQTPADLFLDAQDYLQMGFPNMAARAYKAFALWIEENPTSPARVHLDKATTSFNEQAGHFRPLEVNGRHADVGAGDVVFLQREPASFFYVVEKGAIKISRKKGNRELILAILKPGQIFGEMALLDEQYRAASAVAFKDSRILQLSKDSLYETTGPIILQCLFETLAHRIWYSHQRARLSDIDNPVAKLYMYLQILVADTIRTKSGTKKGPFIFHFSLSELEKMAGVQTNTNDEIQKLLSDDNIEISRQTIRILTKQKLDDKVFQLKKEISIQNSNSPLYV